jgi:hypothetical protein
MILFIFFLFYFCGFYTILDKFKDFGQDLERADAAIGTNFTFRVANLYFAVHIVVYGIVSSLQNILLRRLQVKLRYFWRLTLGTFLFCFFIIG